MPQSVPFAEIQEHAERVKEFTELLFSETEANLLAAAQVPLEDVQALLAKGCSHKWATRILI